MIGANEQVLNGFYGKRSSRLGMVPKIHLEIAHLCIEPRNFENYLYITISIILLYKKA